MATKAIEIVADTKYPARDAKKRLDELGIDWENS